MKAIETIIVLSAIVLMGIMLTPVECAQIDKPIGQIYNETRDILTNCTNILKSICTHNSSMGCFEIATQIQKRLKNVSANNCDETLVRPPKTQKEIRQLLEQLEVMEMVLNEIKKLDADLLDTIESMNKTFVHVSSYVINAIGTLEQVSTKCTEFIPYVSNILNYICIGLLLVSIISISLALLDYMSTHRYRKMKNGSGYDPEKILTESTGDGTELQPLNGTPDDIDGHDNNPQQTNNESAGDDSRIG